MYMLLSRVLCRLLKRKENLFLIVKKSLRTGDKLLLHLSRIISYSVPERKRELSCSLSRLLVALAPHRLRMTRELANCLLVRQLMNKELRKGSEVKNYQEGFDVI